MVLILGGGGILHLPSVHKINKCVLSSTRIAPTMGSEYIAELHHTSDLGSAHLLARLAHDTKVKDHIESRKTPSERSNRLLAAKRHYFDREQGTAFDFLIARARIEATSVGMRPLFPIVCRWRVAYCNSAFIQSTERSVARCVSSFFDFPPPPFLLLEQCWFVERLKSNCITQLECMYIMHMLLAADAVNEVLSHDPPKEDREQRWHLATVHADRCSSE